MKIKILPSAIEDLHTGRLFYEKQGEELGEELGEYFFDTLFSDIDSLLLFPEKHRKIFDYHRLLSKRFPYAVYYKISLDVVIVYRVLDQRQNPDKTKTALPH
ncbi:type II toxin-antitoxin system RelE/ParE family toxin [Pontiellaceae bacterium B12219]|nr:type II toxin-antitoxin system RelE/ParE family toxin [Pontiellaceae bacterium B12219]